MPIQFRATREPVNTDALLKDGSSGEYEANARKRRSAETHSRKPSSSFSRRLFVGLKIRAMNFISGTACVAQSMWCGRPRPRKAHHEPFPTQLHPMRYTRARQLSQEGRVAAMKTLSHSGIIRELVANSLWPDRNHYHSVALHCRRKFTREFSQVLVRPQISYCGAQV